VFVAVARNHSSVLHEVFVTPAHQDATDSPSERQIVEAQSCACGTDTVSECKIALPVVSVIVRGKGMQSGVRVSAFLDPGSNK